MMYRGSNNKLRWCTITTVDTRGTSRWKSGWHGCEEECRENKRGIVIGRRISLGADYFPRINRSFLFVFPFFLSLSLSSFLELLTSLSNEARLFRVREKYIMLIVRERKWLVITVMYHVRRTLFSLEGRAGIISRSLTRTYGAR